MFCQTLPCEVVTLLSSMMARNPRERLASPSEITRQLASWTVLTPEKPEYQEYAAGSFQHRDDPSPLWDSGKEYTFIHFSTTGDVLRVQVPPVQVLEQPVALAEMASDPLAWTMILPLLLLVLILLGCLLVCW